MKLWVLVGLITTAAIPAAYASDTGATCDADDTRAVLTLTAAETPAQVGRPAAQISRETADSAGAASAPAAPGAPNTAPQAAASDQSTRRRGGSRKRIPDAMLIGPRGAL